MNNVKLRKYLNDIRAKIETGVDPDGAIGFVFNETWITNPFYDESFRLEVDPILYYGIKNIELFLAMVKENLGEDSGIAFNSQDATREPAKRNAKICEITFRHGENDFERWFDFTLSEEDENKIMEILSKYETDGCSVRELRANPVL